MMPSLLASPLDGGGVSDRFVKQISQAVQKCYISANVWIVFKHKTYSDVYP